MKSRIKTVVTIILVILRRIFNTLKNYQTYEFESSEDGPEFRYADRSDESLIRLRTTYKLDKLGGEADDIENIINVMSWAHQIVRWGSWAEDISPQNALNIISIANDGRKAVSCRMKATILNEAYLSLGYRSRLITCLPKTDDVTGVHVVNAVYVPRVGKWVYMDPSFGAYFMDEHGNVLGVPEIRERMIKKRPLCVNSNNTWSSREAAYIAYIANNFVRFSCPLVSGFDYETPDKDRSYVELVPKGLMSGKKQVVRPGNGQLVTTHYTSNPDYFWAAPTESGSNP